MNKKELQALVRKYLKGNASPEEKAFVEAWYREMDSNQPIGDILPAAEIEQLEIQMFRNIESRIREGVTTVAARSLPAISPIRPFRRYVAVAASLIFVLTGSWFIYHRFLHSDQALADLYTRPGKVSKLILGDGTLVWLNADSRLKYPKSFVGSGSREIYLEGEAYFEVAKDQGHPFLVHTSSLTTRVLGTRFDVKAYSGKGIEVTLLEGRVMLTAPSSNTAIKMLDTLYLLPNQKALFADNKLNFQGNIAQNPAGSKDSNNALPLRKNLSSRFPASLLKISIPDARGAAAWRDGRLVFDQESLQSVVETLSRKYGVFIKADSVLQSQPVTATVFNMSAEEALLEVTRQLKRNYSKGNDKSGDKVQFRKEGDMYFIE